MYRPTFSNVGRTEGRDSSEYHPAIIGTHQLLNKMIERKESLVNRILGGPGGQEPDSQEMLKSL